MTKFIFKVAFIITLFSSNLISAQEFSGQAFYQYKLKMGEIKLENSSMDDGMKAMIQSKLDKALEKTYVLNFNKFEPMYTQEVKLDQSPQSGMMQIQTTSFGDGPKYKNVKDKVAISSEEFSGKNFLVQDSLQKFDWKLINETKKIGNYTCYKAVYKIPVTEEEAPKAEELKNKSDKKNVFIYNDVITAKEITVWYTPEIPVSQGPGNYWGLPGLILEANDGRVMMLCSKIVLNPSDKKEI